MYDIATRRRALALVSGGRSLNSVSREIGVSRAAIRSWRDHPHLAVRDGLGAPCCRCSPEPRPPDDQAAYAYLLGLYLGDGCISRQPRTYALRIACADAWPGLIAACEQAMTAVRPENSVYRARKQGCVAVTSYSRHWLCLFPQHGPGRKHERRIVLAPWQRAIVDRHPWDLIRGLIHSDGCRITNWTVRTIGGERRRYEYPRYMFTNTSVDIVRLFTETLDAVGVPWRTLGQRRAAVTVSVARREAVALMDAHVGAKY
jgi:hypothetical protein